MGCGVRSGGKLFDKENMTHVARGRFGFILFSPHMRSTFVFHKHYVLPLLPESLPSALKARVSPFLYLKLAGYSGICALAEIVADLDLKKEIGL